MASNGVKFVSAVYFKMYLAWRRARKGGVIQLSSLRLYNSAFYNLELNVKKLSVVCPFQAGCVHFPPVPQCDVKVLLLIFSPKKRAFVGLIPVEQVCISVYVTVHVYQNCLVCVLGMTLH